ncbi:MAG TPA: ACT domain-containing protein [Anaerolineaceae bacterium]|nr:ACT domain-containing protein [Anaerolineaceae bacterium]
MIARSSKPLSLSILPWQLSVCRLFPGQTLPDGLFQSPFWSVTQIGDELSLVILQVLVQPDWKVESGWRCIQVLGPLDFNLIGILAQLSGVLAEADISIFALSTYDTDYLLIKETNLDKARAVLLDSGYDLK